MTGVRQDFPLWDTTLFFVLFCFVFFFNGCFRAFNYSNYSYSLSPFLAYALLVPTGCFEHISHIPGREIAPNTGANATKFFTLATKS